MFSRPTPWAATDRATSIRHGALTGHDGAGPWRASKPREIACERQNAYEDYELNRIRESTSRQQFPHQAQDGLSQTHRPYGTIEIAAFMTLSFGRSHDPRQP